MTSMLTKLAGVGVSPAVTPELSNQMLTNDNHRHRDNCSSQTVIIESTFIFRN